jgi:hypothetical protein
VRWRGHLNIIICAKCCARIKDGLLADIMQVELGGWGMGRGTPKGTTDHATIPLVAHAWIVIVVRCAD